MSDQDVQAALKELREDLDYYRNDSSDSTIRRVKQSSLRLVLDALEARPTKEEAARAVLRIHASNERFLLVLDEVLAERGARKA